MDRSLTYTSIQNLENLVTGSDFDDNLKEVLLCQTRILNDIDLAISQKVDRLEFG